MLSRKKILAALFAIAAAVIISSCGGAGNPNVGQGGPDVSPDQYTDTNAPAVDTTNAGITGTTTPDEGTIVEPVVDIKVEGGLDTATGDTGLADAAAILDGAVSGEVTVPVTDSGASTGTTSTTGTAVTTDTTSGTTGTAVTSDTTSGTTGTAVSTDTTSGTTGTAVSSDTTSGTTVAEDTTAADTTIATGEPVVNGDVVDALEDDEAVAQTGLDYSLDSSQGRWFEETKTELFSDSSAKTLKAEIAALRNEIKAILTSYSKGNTNKEAGKAKIKQLREKIAVLRERIGNGGRLQTGIYTNWANENLFLNIKRGESGWYRVIIVAKNRGKLPENYNKFTFSINNGKDTLAGLSVKSSDNVYYSGSADIKLDNPTGAKLNLIWTNDAYMKDEYDANVSIKKVVLKKIKEPKRKAVNKKRLNGDQFSFMDGRWFFENKAAYTFWANQVIGYTFKNLQEGEYEVTITAKNFGTLPLDKKYKEFDIEVDSDYDSASMKIKADDKSWNKEKIKMNFAEGENTLYITWTNDSYKEKEYDANIMIKSISIKKVQKSSLTAFLLKTKPGNKVFVLGAFLMLSGLIFGIYLKNKTSKEA